MGNEEKVVIYVLKGKETKRVVDHEGQVSIPDKDGLVIVNGKCYRSLKWPECNTGQVGQMPVYTIYLEET